MARRAPGSDGRALRQRGGGEWSSKHLTGRGLSFLQRKSLYTAAGVVSCVLVGRALRADGARKRLVCLLDGCLVGWLSDEAGENGDACLVGDWQSGWVVG